ncbi:MAG: alpha/beta fold hydrolase [Dehalococcoidia bacterium]
MRFLAGRQAERSERRAGLPAGVIIEVRSTLIGGGMQGTAYRDCEVLVGDIKLHYQEWGDESREPITLLHGFGLSGHMFDEFAEHAADHYRLICLDQRGHGDSDWSAEGDYTRDAFVADLEGLRAALNLESFVLVGHSMGGLNAVTYACRHPHRVRKLVLVDVGPEAVREGVDNIVRFTRGPDNLEFEQFVEMAHRFNPRRSLENIRDRMRHRLKRADEDGLWTWKFDSRFRVPSSGITVGSRLTGEETWNLFREVSVPTLLVRGSESDVLSQEVAERAAREMQQARLVVVPGAGHSVPGDGPEVFSREVLGFLAEEEAPARSEPSGDRDDAREPGGVTGDLRRARRALRERLAASEAPGLPSRIRGRRSRRSLLVVAGAAALAAAALVLGVRAISRGGERRPRRRRSGRERRGEAGAALDRAASVFDEIAATGRARLIEAAEGADGVEMAAGSPGDGPSQETSEQSRGERERYARVVVRTAGKGAWKTGALAVRGGRRALRRRRRRRDR